MPDWILQLAIVTVIGYIAFSLKTFKLQLEKKDEELVKKDEQLEEQIKQSSKELTQYKLDAESRFVLKDDFVRLTAQTDRKLDKIYDEIMKLSKHSEAKP